VKCSEAELKKLDRSLTRFPSFHAGCSRLEVKPLEI